MYNYIFNRFLDKTCLLNRSSTSLNMTRINLSIAYFKHVKHARRGQTILHDLYPLLMYVSHFFKEKEKEKEKISASKNWLILASI